MTELSIDEVKKWFSIVEFSEIDHFSWFELVIVNFEVISVIENVIFNGISFNKIGKFNYLGFLM